MSDTDSTYSRMTVTELQSLAKTREIPFKSKTRKADLIAAHVAFDTLQAKVAAKRVEDEAYAAQKIAEHEPIENDFFERMEAAQAIVPITFDEARKPQTLPMSAEEKIDKYERFNKSMGRKGLTVKQRRVIRRTLNRGRSLWPDSIVHYQTWKNVDFVPVKSYVG